MLTRAMSEEIGVLSHRYISGSFIIVTVFATLIAIPFNVVL